MEKYRLTKAVSDLFEICNFISQDNPEAANRVEESILRACNRLADSPLARRVKKDLTLLRVLQPCAFVAQGWDSTLISGSGASTTSSWIQ